MKKDSTNQGINIAFLLRFITLPTLQRLVGIAQLVRAPDCDSGCRGFESRYSPHFFNTKWLLPASPKPCEAV